VGAKLITDNVKRYFAILMAEAPSLRGDNLTASCKKESIPMHFENQKEER
tara:strand:+ start:193 stop:342 length:150 start_codon:yes stop_codon:yes gene_type:complete